MDILNASFTSINDTGNVCIAGVIYTGDASSVILTVRQSLESNNIPRYYVPIASIKHSNKSFNWNKTVDFTGVVDPGEAPK
jgi:hypothetical protein